MKIGVGEVGGLDVKVKGCFLVGVWLAHSLHMQYTGKEPYKSQAGPLLYSANGTFSLVAIISCPYADSLIFGDFPRTYQSRWLPSRIRHITLTRHIIRLPLKLRNLLQLLTSCQLLLVFFTNSLQRLEWSQPDVYGLGMFTTLNGSRVERVW